MSAQAAINDSGQIVAAMTSLRKATRLLQILTRFLKLAVPSVRNVVKETILVRDMASNFSNVVDLDSSSNGMKSYGKREKSAANAGRTALNLSALKV